MRLGSEVNKYLDQTAPWRMVKTEKTAAGGSIYTTLNAIDSLKILFAPFMPFTCDRLHGFLGYEGILVGTQRTETIIDELGQHTVLRYDGSSATGKWEASQLPGGKLLNQPQALFKKLDISIVEEERTRMGKNFS